MFRLKLNNLLFMWVNKGGEAILPAFSIGAFAWNIGQWMRNFFASVGLDSIEDVNVQDMLEYQKGNEEAFQRIYNRNKKKIYGWAFRMLRNQHVAEEISQEVFLRIAKSKSSYKPEAKFTTWAYTITSRLVFNEIRRQGRHPEKILESEDWKNIPDIRVDWVNQMEVNERKEMLEQSLQKIPERQRAAILFRYVNDMSHEEICEVMDLSTQAVKSLLHRGLLSLVDLLKNDGVETDE